MLLTRNVCTAVRRSVTASGLRSLSGVPEYISHATPTDVSQTSNGVRVASETGFGETATVGVWIDAGSRYETEKNNGAAHFLEHMAFKGTKTRTRTKLETEIEDRGAHLNAFTSREHMVFGAKTLGEDIG